MRLKGLACVEKLKKGIANVYEMPNLSTSKTNIHQIDQSNVLNTQ